jgi:hypothetical protein
LNFKILGRERDIAEFIKRGESEAVVEVDLNVTEHGANIRIKRIIKKRTSQYFVNSMLILSLVLSNICLIDNACTEKQIREVMKSLNIQLDNLCMFLPQERISEFSALSKETLLRETMLAVNPELYSYFRILCELQIRCEKLVIGIEKKHKIVEILEHQSCRYRDETYLVSRRISMGVSIAIAKTALMLLSWIQLETRIVEGFQRLKKLRQYMMLSLSSDNTFLIEKRAAKRFGIIHGQWLRSLAVSENTEGSFCAAINLCGTAHDYTLAISFQSLRKEQTLVHVFTLLSD